MTRSRRPWPWPEPIITINVEKEVAIRKAHRDLYPQLAVFDKPVPTEDPVLVAERRTWREAALLVVELLHTLKGHGPEQRGQRRGLRRALTKINLELAARGGERIDDGESWSADEIDEGLRA